MKVSRFAQKLATALFKDASEEESFLRAISDSEESPRLQKALYWLDSPEWGAQDSRFPDWIRITPDESHPGKHQDFDAGKYYVADISSVLEGMVFTAMKEKPSIIADVCAAPGGKSVFAQRMFSPEVLIANDSVEKRVKALISNFSRCHIPHAVVTCGEVHYLKRDLERVCDLVIVDAPCSGQSLNAKNISVDNPFHPVVINRSVRRQRKILSDASALVSGGGHLAYMTCTFSPEENEEMIAWFQKEFPEFSAVEVPALTAYQSFYTDTPCYRFFPHRENQGAGGFAALLKRGEGIKNEISLSSVRIFWRSDRSK